MALLTPLPLDEARAIARSFGLTLARVETIVAGSVNSNFRWLLDDGDAVFARIYEESDHRAVEEQNRLLAHLAAHGVKTPLPRSRDGGGTVATFAGKPLCVFPFCDGDWICQRGVTEARLEQIGAVLARIHRAGESFSGPPPSRFGFDAIAARLTGLEARDLSPELTGHVAKLRALHTELAAAPPPAETTVIHGDVFRDNVLWHDDGTLSAVLDFESASAGAPAFDLAVTALAWCFGDALDPALVGALGRGYAAEGPLEDALVDASFAQARVAALRFAVTRITDYELRPRGVVAFKDYRRFLQRLEAVEAWGRDGWRARLTGE